MYRIDYRSPTWFELRQRDLPRRRDTTWLVRSGLAIAVAGLLVVAGGPLIGWPIASAIGATLLITLVLVGPRPRLMPQEPDTARCGRQRGVEEITIRCERAYLQQLPGQRRPSLVLPVDEDTALILTGKFLRRHEVYELDDFAETAPGTFNRLAEPFAFPSSECVVSRDPATGRVLAIRPQGRYIEPEKRPPSTGEPEQWRECELVRYRVEDPHLTTAHRIAATVN